MSHHGHHFIGTSVGGDGGESAGSIPSSIVINVNGNDYYDSLTMEDVPNYSMAMLLSQGREQISDQVLGFVIFTYAILQRNEIDKSIYGLAILACLLAVYFVCIWLKARLVYIANKNYQKKASPLKESEIMLATSKVLYLATAYVLGIMVRMLVDKLQDGSSGGHFTTLGLILPLCVFLMVWTEMRMVYFRGDLRKKTLQEHICPIAAVVAVESDTTTIV